MSIIAYKRIRNTMERRSKVKTQYELKRGGWVKFDMESEVQSIQPKYEDTIVVLNNGVSYLLRGRNYGV
jgi:hypothetical protein